MTLAAMTVERRTTGQVLGVTVDALDWEASIERILSWGRERQSRYVTVCNVHVVVTASQDEEFGDVIEKADMATPDGAPVAWMLRWQGFYGQPRISGPDLMWALCAHSAAEGMSVYFFGSTESTLRLLAERIKLKFPTLGIVGMESPPFRELSTIEDEAAVERIRASKANFVFVGLGCPKQERWMADHRGRVNAVMIGVGAAFDFHAGVLKRAPRWMRDSGLEWAHRLASEPRRLWRRYLVTNTLFVVGVVRQILKRRALRIRG